MKAIVRLITLVAMPMCSSLFLQAQPAPSPAQAAEAPQAVPETKPPPQPGADVQYDKNLAIPRNQQLLRAMQPSAGTGGGGGMGGYGSASGAFSTRLQHIINRAAGPGPAPTQLIVRSSAMDPKSQANLEEDLAIMARILNKAVDDGAGNGPGMAMGIDVFGAQGSVGGRTLYLEDYGALFTLNVGFPLVAAQSGPEEKKEETPADSTWEEAKRELYGPGPNTMMPGVPFEEFSAEKVNKLTDALVDALRNAKNIRGLKNEDAITVCVLGTAAIPDNRGKQRVAGALPPSPPPPGAVSYAAAGPQKGTVMTIRVKKADADAFAKGGMNAEEFRKRARIERYEGGPAVGAQMGFGGGYGRGYGTMGWMGGYGGGGKK